MKKIQSRGFIGKRVSTMPQKKTEASQQLKQRLNFLENQIASTEQTIQDLRHSVPSSPKVKVQPQAVVESTNFQAFYLEY